MVPAKPSVTSSKIIKAHNCSQVDFHSLGAPVKVLLLDSKVRDLGSEKRNLDLLGCAGFRGGIEPLAGETMVALVEEPG